MRFKVYHSSNAPALMTEPPQWFQLYRPTCVPVHACIITSQLTFRLQITVGHRKMAKEFAHVEPKI